MDVRMKFSNFITLSSDDITRLKFRLVWYVVLCNWLKKLSKVNISVILYFVVGGHSTTTWTKILSNFDPPPPGPSSSEQLMTFYMIPTLCGLSTDPSLFLFA